MPEPRSDKPRPRILKRSAWERLTGQRDEDTVVLYELEEAS